MANVQIAIIDQENTQIALAVPGIQGPVGQGVPNGGAANQVLFKQSGTDYDTAWSEITSDMIGDLEIVNADVSASAAIAGTKISPDFGSQAVVTTGTSTAASFIPTSSTVPTNGVYLPAANNVAISTGGTGRLFVDANGNVGVGDSTPDSILDIASDTPILYLEDTAAYGSTGSQITFRGPDSGGTTRNMAAIVGVGSGSNSGQLVFQTRNSGSLADRVTITSDGKLGLGTSVPGQQMVVRGSQPFLEIRDSRTGNWSGGDVFSGILFGTDDTTTAVDPHAFIKAVHTRAGSGHSSADAGLTFGTSASTSTPATERMRIDSTGNVGIGTATPDSLLEVDAGTGSDAGITIRMGTANSGANDSHISFKNSAGSQIFRAEYDNTTPKFKIFSDQASDAFTILRAGNVGIGTTSPSQILSVGASTGRIFTVNQGTANKTILNNDYGLELRSNGGYQLIHNANNSLGSISFQINSSEKGRIDSSGRLLVGTSTARSNVDYQFGLAAPKQQLELADGGLGFSIIQNYDSGTAATPAYLTLARAGSTAIGNTTIVANNNWLGEIDFSGSDGTDFTRAASIRAEVDGTPGANDMPGRLVFSTTAAGASSPTERMRIRSTGQVYTFASGNNAFAVGCAGPTSGINAAIYLFSGATAIDNGTITFQVLNNGNVQNANNSYGPISSDERLKQDIVDAGTQWDDIKAVRLTKFRYKNDPTGELQLGPIAQELEQVSPGLITRRPASEDEIADPSNDLVDGDEVLSFKASILYMKAVKALQEAMERIEVLEQRLTDAGIA